MFRRNFQKVEIVGTSDTLSQPLILRGRTIWIADAHRDNGKRLVARSEEKLTAFLELERVTRESLHFQNAG
jgi:hypothetical protein